MVPGGIEAYWALHLSEFSNSTAKKEKRKQVLALMIPAALTAMLTGITEPIEFTFLFIAPVLFGVHALLCACINAVMYAAGVSGAFGNGLIA